MTEGLRGTAAFAKRILETGTVILPANCFFRSRAEAIAAVEQARRYIRRCPEKPDQPGSRRYHLDTPEMVELLAPWIRSSLTMDLCARIFGSAALFVKFVRGREPLPQQGDQDFHQDWRPGHARERMELFVALDDVRRDNGPLEVVHFAGGPPSTMTWDAGEMVMMDSTLFHRGTANRSGDARLLVDIHVGAVPEPGEQVLAWLGDDASVRRARR